jgi:hypothetical protein
MKHLRRFSLWISIGLLAAMLSPARAAAPAAEKWFVIVIADVPVGYIHDMSSRKSGPAAEILVYSSEMRLVLNRLGHKVEMRFLTVSEETPDGRLLRETYEMQASLVATRTEAVVKDGRIEFRSETGGKTYDRTIPYTGTLLGQEGIRLLSQKKLHKPGDAVDFQTFSPEIEAVVRGTRKFLSAETIDLNGTSLPTIKIEETIESAGVKSTGWLDENHEVVRQDMPTPFGPSVFVLADRASALRAAEGGALPAEMFERSIIRTNVRIPQARALATLRVRLTARDADIAWPGFKGPDISVISREGTSLTLELRRRRPPKSVPFPVPETEGLREYFRPNAYVQSDLPDIRKLAGEVIGGEADLFKAAMKLRRWVADNMTFDLGIALAPSSEIFANRRGTCLGYATILATLARAVGIPSRVVMGYAYALGMFGGHAWTEIRVGEEWIPIDAALPSDGPADAARIPLGASSFAEGGGSFGAGPGIQILGRIDITVLGFTESGRRDVIVPDNAVPHRLDGDVYANPWLGVELAKPPDFKFSGTDFVWPSAVVAAVEGAGGVRAELQEQYLPPWKTGEAAAADIFKRLKIAEAPVRRDLGPLPGYLSATAAPTGSSATQDNPVGAVVADRAAFVVIDGGEAWVLVAEGPGAPALLEKLASGLKIGLRK